MQWGKNIYLNFPNDKDFSVPSLKMLFKLKNSFKSSVENSVYCKNGHFKKDACAFPVKSAKCFLRLFVHTLEQFGKTFSYVLLKMIGAFTKSQTFSITTVSFAIHNLIVFFLLLKLFEALNRNVWLVQALIIWNDIKDGRLFNGRCFCQTLIKF